MSQHANTIRDLRSMARQLRDTANLLERQAKDLVDLDPPKQVMPDQLKDIGGMMHPRETIKKEEG